MHRGLSSDEMALQSWSYMFVLANFFSLRKKLSALSKMGIWTAIADILEFRWNGMKGK